MAKEKRTVETVTMTSPKGTKVTVGKDDADTYKARGYKAAASK